MGSAFRNRWAPSGTGRRRPNARKRAPRGPRPRHALRGVIVLLGLTVAIAAGQGLWRAAISGDVLKAPSPAPTVVRSAVQPLRIRPLPCTSALLLEAETGAVLYAQNADESRGPASLVKMMLLVLAYEALDRGEITPGTKVRTSRNAATMGGSQVFLEEGETRTVADLLDAISMASANDASMALAEHMAGSEAAFVKRMNARARELGCTGTRFANVHGLDLKNQRSVTTARDLGRIARELVRHPRALEVSATRRKQFRGDKFWLDNTNHLLGRFEGLDGLKTGWTPRAGGCFVATAERDGVRLIGVVLAAGGGRSRFRVAAQLLEAGYAVQPEWHQAVRAGDVLEDIGRIPDAPGGEETRLAVAAGNVRLLVERARAGKVSARLRRGDAAPAGAEGTPLAWVDFRLDGRTVATIPARPGRRG